MKFACDQCHTRYSISDDRVHGRVLKIRCKHCGHIVTVKESMALKETGPHAITDSFGGGEKTQISDRIPVGVIEARASQIMSTAPAPTAAAQAVWYLSFEGSQEGPFTSEKAIQRMRQEKRNPSDVYCWQQGFAEWLSIDRVPELHRALTATPPPLPATPSARHAVGAATQSVAGSPAKSNPISTGFNSPMPAAASASKSSAAPVRESQIGVAAKPRLDPTVNTSLAPPRASVSPAPVAAGASESTENEFLIGEASGLINLSLLAQATQAPAKAAPVATPTTTASIPLATPIQSPAANLNAYTTGPNVPPLKQSQGWVKWVATGGVVTAVVLAIVLISVLRRPAQVQERVEVRRQLDNAPILFRDAPETIAGAKAGDVKNASPLVRKSAAPANHAGGAEAKPGAKPEGGSNMAAFYADSKDRDLSLPGRPGGGGGNQPVSQQAINNTISQNRRSLNACYERVLKHDTTLKRAKINTHVNIGLSGTVTKVSIMDAQYARAEIGQCLVQAIRSWHFPSSGEEYETEFPILLQAN